MCELLEGRDCGGNASCSVFDKLLQILGKSSDSQFKLHLQEKRQWWRAVTLTNRKTFGVIDGMEIAQDEESKLLDARPSCVNRKELHNYFTFIPYPLGNDEDHIPNK